MSAEGGHGHHGGHGREAGHPPPLPEVLDPIPNTPEGVFDWVTRRFEALLPEEEKFLDVLKQFNNKPVDAKRLQRYRALATEKKAQLEIAFGFQPEKHKKVTALFKEFDTFLQEWEHDLAEKKGQREKTFEAMKAKLDALLPNETEFLGLLQDMKDNKVERKRMEYYLSQAKKMADSVVRALQNLQSYHRQHKDAQAEIAQEVGQFFDLDLEMLENLEEAEPLFKNLIDSFQKWEFELASQGKEKEEKLVNIDLLRKNTAIPVEDVFQALRDSGQGKVVDDYLVSLESDALFEANFAMTPGHAAVYTEFQTREFYLDAEFQARVFEPSKELRTKAAELKALKDKWNDARFRQDLRNRGEEANFAQFLRDKIKEVHDTQHQEQIDFDIALALEKEEKMKVLEKEKFDAMGVEKVKFLGMEAAGVALCSSEIDWEDFNLELGKKIPPESVTMEMLFELPPKIIEGIVENMNSMQLAEVVRDQPPLYWSAAFGERMKQLREEYKKVAEHPVFEKGKKEPETAEQKRMFAEYTRLTKEYKAAQKTKDEGKIVEAKMKRNIFFKKEFLKIANQSRIAAILRGDTDPDHVDEYTSFAFKTPVGLRVFVKEGNVILGVDPLQERKLGDEKAFAGDIFPIDADYEMIARAFDQLYAEIGSLPAEDTFTQGQRADIATSLENAQRAEAINEILQTEFLELERDEQWMNENVLDIQELDTLLQKWRTAYAKIPKTENDFESFRGTGGSAYHNVFDQKQRAFGQKVGNLTGETRRLLLRMERRMSRFETEVQLKKDRIIHGPPPIPPERYVREKQNEVGQVLDAARLKLEHLIWEYRGLDSSTYHAELVPVRAAVDYNAYESKNVVFGLFTSKQRAYDFDPLLGQVVQRSMNEKEFLEAKDRVRRAEAEVERKIRAMDFDRAEKKREIINEMHKQENIIHVALGKFQEESKVKLGEFSKFQIRTVEQWELIKNRVEAEIAA